MCVALPGKIVQMWEDDDIWMALVDFEGFEREVNLMYTPEASVGDAVVVHSGFAIRSAPLERVDRS